MNSSSFHALLIWVMLITGLAHAAPINYADGDLAPLSAPDSLVDIADYLIATRIVAGELSPTELELSHGDLYPSGAPDGLINLQDLLLLQQRIIDGTARYVENLNLFVEGPATITGESGTNSASTTLIVGGFTGGGALVTNNANFTDPDDSSNTIWQFAVSGGVANVYLGTGDLSSDSVLDTGFDLSGDGQGQLIFDIRVNSLSAGAALTVKIDSGYPDLGQVTLDPAELTIGSWQRIAIDFADFLADPGPGAGLDLENVLNAFVFEVTGGSADVYLDNIFITHACPEVDGCNATIKTKPPSFTLVLLPDTQHYSDSSVNIVNFVAQTQWIVTNQATEGIVFSTLLGDVVQNGGEGIGQNQVEWDRALLALDELHDDVNDPPYSTVAGNHDYDTVGSKSSATQYIANLGPARYAGKSWFVGFAPDDVNMAQVFVGDGDGYLHIGLEWLPSDDAIKFAQQVITANPTVPVILSTHEHLGTGNPASRRNSGSTPNATGDNDAEQVYRKLVEPFPQVFLVLSGHVYGNGRLASTTVLDRLVHEVMTDYQNDPNGGNGWFQLVKFRPDSDEIVFDTTSPTYVSGVTSGLDRSGISAGNFTLTYDLEDQLDYLQTHEVLHFRQDQDNGFGTYTSAVDTHVGDGGSGTTLPGVANGGADNVRIDGDSDHEQGLLRFDDIVGAGAGQVPAGATVEKAILTLSTEGPSSDGSGAKLHRMLVAWDGSSSWNSLGGGVQLDDTEALVLEDADTGNVAKGTRSYDVTTSVQAWVNGATNHGWVLIANGNDRWEFRSSEWAGLVERPMLTVLLSAE